MVKHELASRGMYETVTFSFTDSNIAKYFRRGPEAVFIQNPIINELDEMRPSLLPNLLIGAKNNIARGYGNLALFEAAPEFFGRNPGEQRAMASGIRVGKTAKRTGQTPCALMTYLTSRLTRWQLLPRRKARLRHHRLRPTHRLTTTRGAAALFDSAKRPRVFW